jgi:HSP20 family protein
MAKNNEVAVVQRGNILPAVRNGAPERFVTPSTDIFETPDAYVIVIDLPGAEKESIRVTTENGTMSVKAKVEQYHRDSANLLLSEMRAPTYYRVFNLADGIDRSSIDAQYEHGVLTIKLFKKEETRSREIQIK